MKMMFNLDDDLPLKKTLELRNMVIVVWSVLHEGNKYYPQLLLVECLYKSKMLEYLKELMLIQVNDLRESVYLSLLVLSRDKVLIPVKRM